MTKQCIFKSINDHITCEKYAHFYEELMLIFSSLKVNHFFDYHELEPVINFSNAMHSKLTVLIEKMKIAYNK